MVLTVVICSPIGPAEQITREGGGAVRATAFTSGPEGVLPGHGEAIGAGPRRTGRTVPRDRRRVPFRDSLNNRRRSPESVLRATPY
ncbi:hypothetical protein ACWDR1_35980, partial [Streptosporangium sandarakinum]